MFTALGCIRLHELQNVNNIISVYCILYLKTYFHSHRLTLLMVFSKNVHDDSLPVSIRLRVEFLVC